MQKSKDFIYRISAVSILVSAMLYLFIPIIAAWLMIVSVLAFTITTAMTPYPGKSIRGKRLYNFQIIACICMLVAAYFMYMHDYIWALFMLIGTVFLLYSAIVMPKELEKENLNKHLD